MDLKETFLSRNEIYRGRIIELRVKPKGVTLTLISGEPISVTIYGRPYEIEDVLTVPLEG